MFSDKTLSTPLLDYIREQRLEKRAKRDQRKEAKRKREEERRKQRDEERKKRREKKEKEIEDHENRNHSKQQGEGKAETKKKRNRDRNKASPKQDDQKMDTKAEPSNDQKIELAKPKRYSERKRDEKLADDASKEMSELKIHENKTDPQKEAKKEQRNRERKEKMKNKVLFLSFIASIVTFSSICTLPRNGQPSRYTDLEWESLARTPLKRKKPKKSLPNLSTKRWMTGNRTKIREIKRTIATGETNRPTTISSRIKRMKGKISEKMIARALRNSRISLKKSRKTRSPLKRWKL